MKEGKAESSTDARLTDAVNVKLVQTQLPPASCQILDL
jgi:hypothetical protein